MLGLLQLLQAVDVLFFTIGSHRPSAVYILRCWRLWCATVRGGCRVLLVMKTARVQQAFKFFDTVRVWRFLAVVCRLVLRMRVIATAVTACMC